jgi:hypothetical protein
MVLRIWTDTDIPTACRVKDVAVNLLSRAWRRSDGDYRVVLVACRADVVVIARAELICPRIEPAERETLFHASTDAMYLRVELANIESLGKVLRLRTVVSDHPIIDSLHKVAVIFHLFSSAAPETRVFKCIHHSKRRGIYRAIDASRLGAI